MSNAMILSSVAACVAVAVCAALAFFQWQERRRVRRVGTWVRNLLVNRYGALPERLSISGFEDFLCPVVVRFVHPNTGVQHRMEFSCPGSVSSFQLISERPEPR